jgi:hypothetical protein
MDDGVSISSRSEDLCSPSPALHRQPAKVNVFYLCRKVKTLSTTPRRRIGEWRYSSIILDLGTRRTWVVSFTQVLLYPRYPSERRLGGPQSRSKLYVEEKNNLAPARNWNRAASPKPVVIPTELSKLFHFCWRQRNPGHCISKSQHLIDFQL